MSFRKTITRNLGWLALLLGAAALRAAQPATSDTTGCALAINNGVIVGFSNRLCDEIPPSITRILRLP